MRIGVVGLGYIGLPTALMLGSQGKRVIGIDSSREVVDRLNRGELTFQEEGMDEIFESALQNGVVFSNDYVQADIYIIAVPTPYVNDTKQVDATYVVSAVKSILDVCRDGAVVVLESTVPPGTVDKRIRPLVDAHTRETGKTIHLAHAPERIIPGNMIFELRNNNRTIGADDPEIAEAVRQVYSSFCEADIAVTDIKTAEMSKVVENTFRDVNIAYANELLKICNAGGLDVYEVIRIANQHPRVNILNPGPGVGGHCISVDPWFLVGDYPEIVDLVRSARHVNDSMPDYVLERTYRIMQQNDVEDVSKVGFYGLSYKEDVDDIRESPTLQLYESMNRHLSVGAARFYDPFIADDVVKNQFHSLDAFLRGLEIVVVMVAHSEILASIDKLKGMVVLDTRNCVNGPNVVKL